jgi:hypothetical protein
MNVEKPNGSLEAKAGKPRSPSAKKAPKRKAVARSTAAKAKRAPGAARRAAGTSLNKAAFVRNQPVGMPAKDVVVAASRLGMTMTPDYVHKVRSTAKARGRAPSLAARKPARKASSRSDFRFGRPLGVVRAGTPEAAFRKLVLELGMQRAKDLLADVERKLGALIRG